MNILEEMNFNINGKVGSTVYYTIDNILMSRAYFIPVQPGTIPQLERWDLFRRGVKAWQSRTPEEKEEYKQQAVRFKFTGFNLFMRLWLEGRIILIKQVLRGNQLLSNGQHNITIAQVDMTKSFLTYNCGLAIGGNTGQIVFGCHWARIENSTTIKVQIDIVGTVQQFNFTWQVVEFF